MTRTPSQHRSSPPSSRHSPLNERPYRLIGFGPTNLAGLPEECQDGPGLLNPLRPDRLGAALVSRVLRDRRDGAHHWLGRVLGLPSDGQAARCLDVLAGLSAMMTLQPGPPPLLSAAPTGA
jgi:hypothetical protein